MTVKKLLIITQAVDEADPILGFFVRWIAEFAQHTEQIMVICLSEGKHTLPQNVAVYSLGKERGVSRMTYVWNFYRYIVRFRRDYDSVFVHMNPEYVLLGGPLWRLWGKRIALWYAHKSVTLRLRLAERLVHVLYTASKESFRLTSTKLRVMGHGIDTNRYTPPRVDRAGVVRLMTSGRVSRVKGLEVILDAYHALVTQHIPATLAVYGAPVTHEDRAYADMLSAQLRAKGENPDDFFRGSVPHAEMPLRRASADYFLHASHTGSLDKTVLDAIMSGVIPISSSDAYRDLFHSYEPFLHFAPGDAPALAEHIRALEALPEIKRDDIRATLRTQVIAQHSLQHLIPNILKAFAP